MKSECARRRRKLLRMSCRSSMTSLSLSLLRSTRGPRARASLRTRASPCPSSSLLLLLLLLLLIYLSDAFAGSGDESTKLFWRKEKTRRATGSDVRSRRNKKRRGGEIGR
eukprot:306099-Hanusia_phi.AAC.1